VLDQHNATRRELSIGPLGLCPVLQEAARTHATWMNRRRRLTHYGSWWSSPTSRVRNIQAGMYSHIAENIALAPGASVDAVFKEFLDSSKHKRNALNPDFNRVGWYVSGAYWCVVYGRSNVDLATV
jgi:uncharacterized protein YkwD